MIVDKKDQEPPDRCKEQQRTSQSSHASSSLKYEPPYYAVIFTSTLTGNDSSGYQKVGTRLDELARMQGGCLGVESARNSKEKGRLGITVSYWKSKEAIQAWKREAEHTVAQNLGRSTWYQNYTVRVAKVEREYSFESPKGGNGESNK